MSNDLRCHLSECCTYLRHIHQPLLPVDVWLFFSHTGITMIIEWKQTTVFIRKQGNDVYRNDMTIRNICWFNSVYISVRLRQKNYLQVIIISHWWFLLFLNRVSPNMSFEITFIVTVFMKLGGYCHTLVNTNQSKKWIFIVIIKSTIIL
jgi:hypothetical protein